MPKYKFNSVDSIWCALIAMVLVRGQPRARVCACVCVHIEHGGMFASSVNHRIVSLRCVRSSVRESDILFIMRLFAVSSSSHFRRFVSHLFFVFFCCLMFVYSLRRFFSFFFLVNELATA